MTVCMMLAAGLLLLADGEGGALEGYALMECETVTANAIKCRVGWKGTERIGVAGKPVRLRVVMRSAKLYSLRFVST